LAKWSLAAISYVAVLLYNSGANRATRKTLKKADAASNPAGIYYIRTTVMAIAVK
jgi:hypothetical protein